jgi:hypothetical protein
MLFRDEVQSLALVVPDEGLDSKEGWNFGGDAKVMVDQMDCFHPSLIALARYGLFLSSQLQISV